VVLVPGTFSDRRIWLRLVGTLSAKFRCLLLDPRGTGATPDPGVPFTPDDLVDDVLTVMDAAGVRRAHVVGHSLGAAVALLAAARHPARVDRAVLVGPAFLADPYVDAVLDHWEALARSDLPAEALHLGLVLPAFGREAFERLVPAVVQDMNRRPLSRETILRYVACDRTQDVRPVAGRVDASVLVVAGAEDSLTGPVHARALAGAIPAAALRLVPGCGHTPQVERPADLARLVVPFLQRRELPL
jgi:pimeloyl-ACP methyl ester carboxylesterase